ncbi:MAG: hypothetical protein KAX40_02385 [Herpetosiphon sp.]|nr:hypothetical protein [Herpetosiphon sp.]
MADEVYMDIPAVRNVAKTFGTVSEVLANVAKVLDMLSNTLKATAFIGLVGGAVVAQFIDAVKPHIEDMSRKCQELNQDVSASVDAYERGDQQGATRFY